MEQASVASKVSDSKGLEISIVRPLDQRGCIRIDSTHHLCSVGLRELWGYRELLYFLVWRELKVRYKQTVIGSAWAVIQPFFMMVVFTVFFGIFARLPSKGLPYPIFYYSALLPWLYFAGALQQATNTMVENQRLITKVYFPRLILPLAAVTSGLVDFGVAFLMLVGMMAFYGVSFSLSLLFLPLFLLFALITALGVGVWLAALNAMYRDIRYATPFFIQLWMFASPVAYSADIVSERWRWLFALNPMTGVIEGFRWAIFGQGDISFMLMLSVCSVIVIACCGIVYFYRVEDTIVDRI
jgi:lipopolysaccharide transport system permease protein